MKSINPYLNFNGNTEEAFNFYKSVFDGEFLMIDPFEKNLRPYVKVEWNDKGKEIYRNNKMAN